MGRQGLARTRGLLQGWGLPLPLARGVRGGPRIGPVGLGGITCPVVPEAKALRDPTKGLDIGGLRRGASRQRVLVLGLGGALAHLLRCTCPGS